MFPSDAKERQFECVQWIIQLKHVSYI